MHRRHARCAHPSHCRASTEAAPVNLFTLWRRPAGIPPARVQSIAETPEIGFSARERRGGDSNPRTRSTPVTRFPVAPVQPLRHLSRGVLHAVAKGYDTTSAAARRTTTPDGARRYAPVDARGQPS